MSRINSLDDLPIIPKNKSQSLIYTRIFPNGEWIAARTEYACSDGAGFDATVFRGSKGRILYQTEHHFCGYEGLSSELNDVTAETLVDFYNNLTNINFIERK